MANKAGDSEGSSELGGDASAPYQDGLVSLSCWTALDRQDNCSLDEFLLAIENAIDLPSKNNQGDRFAYDDQGRIVAFQYYGAAEAYRIHYDDDGKLDCIVVPGPDGLIWQDTGMFGLWMGTHKISQREGIDEGLLRSPLKVTIDHNGIHLIEFIDKDGFLKKDFLDWSVLHLPLKEWTARRSSINH